MERNRNETYYIKKGRKYIPIQRYDVDGLGEGLWLITKGPNYESRQNLLYAVRTHQIQEVGKFCDFYKAHKDKLDEIIIKEYDNFFEQKKEKSEYFSRSEIVDCIISALSKIED